MKKTYLVPEMEVVKMQTMSVLAASETVPVNDGTITNENQFLAPELSGGDDVDW